MTELRFAFGKNWKSFLKGVSEQAIDESYENLKAMIGREDLEGMTFLDVGSGSGLSSLSAIRLGAYQVVSFDIDQDSVRCTEETRDQFDIPQDHWKILHGSALDESFLAELGQFDFVYSWGVLHHTGDMWQAIANVEQRVGPSGYLYVALYNDQGWASRAWLFIKWLYNRMPTYLRPFVFWPAFLRLWGPTTIKDLAKGKPFHTWRSYAKNRGMSPMTDAVDWVGGYPFEVATPARVTKFISELGYEAINSKTVGRGRACNEFVFRRKTESQDGA